jgi:hypothetical protein|tara:strand:- start:3125 stop:3628 length:504 start_codon:yes stop_codon:yes gene_type:complete
VCGAASVLAVALTLGGCASEVANLGVASASPSPTCAVAEQPGIEPAPGCVAYDAEKNMASNELYRQRMEQPQDGREAGSHLIAPVTAALEAVRVSSAGISETAVRAALVEAGVTEANIQSYERNGDVPFGVAVVGGGCLFGAVTPEGVQVEVGGFIMDGGCLPAPGH